MTRDASTGRSATAVAHPNIALIKYWGKRDEELMLPATDSLSMTLDIYPTTTTVRVLPTADRDDVYLDGQPAAGAAAARVVRFLDILRAAAGRPDRVRVDSRNTVPTSAGLASSAAGFAALALAGAAVFGLDPDPTAVSRLARRGSGSASRSLFGGFAVWHAGEGDGAAGDRSSYAAAIDGGALDPALVVALVDPGPKVLSSREAMRRTVDTSPLYPAWVDASKPDLIEMREAIAAGDLPVVGEIAERNALGMHAVMQSARPAVRYLTAASWTVIDRVETLRRRGVCAHVTIDAGPNVKVLCARADAAQVAQALAELECIRTIAVAKPGPGARLIAGGQP
ncbi:diphosphomevalonate decarboxylase [Nocardia brasiliensis]